mmetsp:Transcript_130585/g.225833  ORF Transcript_130585/g.225833 Transcript_130585/m.225833 type:complete len:210 (+) Transcript_130585:1097-1726(+)
MDGHLQLGPHEQYEQIHPNNICTPLYPTSLQQNGNILQLMHMHMHSHARASVHESTPGPGIRHWAQGFYLAAASLSRAVPMLIRGKLIMDIAAHLTSASALRNNNGGALCYLHGCHSLCYCGVNTNCGIELRLANASLHCDCKALNDLPGVGAQHVDPHDTHTVCCMANNLHITGFAVPLWQLPLEWGKGGVIHLHIRLPKCGASSLLS